MFKYFLLVILAFSLLNCAPPLDPYSTGASSQYGSYSNEAVEYFLQIGLCPEYGNCKDPRVRKWNSSIYIKLDGNYTDLDSLELDRIIVELRQLTGLSISRVEQNANINIYFTERRFFNRYISFYTDSNPQDGAFEFQSDDSGIYYKGNICIRSDLVDQTKRNHLLREELTQIIGLPQDSGFYFDSVFQEDPTFKPTIYSNIDRQVIQILYDQRIKPGMTAQEVRDALSGSTHQQVAISNIGN